MAASPAQVIQIGGKPLQLEEWLPYYYVDFDTIETAQIKDIPLMIKGKINPRLSRYSYLITVDSPVVQQLDWLGKLPANNVILDDQIKVPDRYQKLFQIMNVQYLSFADISQLADTLILNFFQGQSGFVFDTHDFQIASDFPGIIEQHGDNKIIFKKAAIDKLHLLGSFGRPIFFLGNSQWEILPECDVSDARSQLEFHIRLIAPNSGEEQLIIIKGDQLHQTTYLPPFKEAMFVSVNVYGKGPGKLYVGYVHIRQSRNGRGFLQIGGEHQILDQHMNQEITFYFNAGDRKPPLNVYFSGYRQAEGFEGNNMMANMQSPYILVRDPRIIGGGFYVGSPEYESGVPTYIKTKLAELDFTSQDLILSGTSMGSFGALYYAPDLDPAAVIVGKPLIHLGTIAETTRIDRRNMFDVDWDTLALWTGGTTEADVAKANQNFMLKFKTGDFSQTQFAIAYMKDDDYDHDAFQDLNHYLRWRYPKIQLLHRGFLGRHNDNTPAIFKWFVAQYHRILTTKFNRNFEEGD